MTGPDWWEWAAVAVAVVLLGCTLTAVLLAVVS